MKTIFAGLLFLVLSAGCTKNNNDDVLIDEATVTILHSTCVKTILKIDSPNTNIGVSWGNTRIVNPVLYQHVIQAGDMKNVPVTGLEVSKQYKVRIYKKATGPEVFCYLLDQVNEPGIIYDIEFIK